jgi:uncharacterized protein (TIGR01777 family)
LVAKLDGQGHEVTVLSRRPESKRGLIPARVQLAKWDAQSAEGWGHLAEGADALLNLAGENLAGEGLIPTRWTKARKQKIMDSRVQAGRAVVRAVEAAADKPKVVIQASAVGYYGARLDEPLTEAARPGADFLARVCVEWERSSQPVEALGVRRAIIRSGVFLSPQSGALARLLLPFRFFVGGPMGSGNQWLSWIHPQDEIEAILYLIKHEGAQGPFNLCSPVPVTNRTFAKRLGRVLRRPAFFRIPGFLLRAALGEVASTVLEGQRALPQALQDLGYDFRFPQIEPALRDVLQG